MHVEYPPPRITPCWIPTTIKECKTRVKCQDEGEHLTTTHREPTHVLVWGRYYLDLMPFKETVVHNLCTYRTAGHNKGYRP